MKPKVYVETTVLSYLTARPSKDVVVAGHQETTLNWWPYAQNRFQLLASELVVQEASAGDPQAADQRLEALAPLDLLETTGEALALAEELVASGVVPQKAAEDALHVAVAVTNGVEYLVTWNCRHIANATLRPKIETICKQAGYEPTIICTPEELLDEEE